MDNEPQFLLFGLHNTLWSAYQLETAIQELIQDNYIIDPAGLFETKQSLIMRLGNFQQELTQEEVSSITQRFQDKGYIPRGRVSESRRADGGPSVAAGPRAAATGAAINNNIQAGIAEEGIGMQHQQPRPLPQNNGLRDPIGEMERWTDRIGKIERLLATERASLDTERASLNTDFVRFTGQINALQQTIATREDRIRELERLLEMGKANWLTEWREYYRSDQ